MIFRKGRDRRDEIDDEDDEQELETVLFQGALNGEEPDLKANPRLVQVGLPAAKQIVTDALHRRAETIRIEPKGQAAMVRLEVDGIPYPGARMPRQQALAVTQMLKLLAGLDVGDRKRPQSGGIKAELEKIPYELRVESTPIADGAERLSIQTKNLKQKVETPEALGIPQEVRQTIRDLTSQRSGTVLACGPPHSGTSTTAYGVLRCVDAYMFSIFSIGDLGGRDNLHITDFEVNPADSFETMIERVARAEADVLFVDPIRNAEQAKNVFAQQRRMAMVAEFTARDAAHGIQQLCQWVGDPKLVADGLRAIVSQKLIRLLCTDCREAYRPHPKLLAKIGLPPETKLLYRHARPPVQVDPEEEIEYEPCRACGAIGYRGRTGLFEMIEMTEGVKALVARGGSVPEIKALARDEGMPTLQREGLRLVAEGKTSLEELQRVFKAP